MKYNELTVRELHAQAKAACIGVIRLLDESQRSKFSHLAIYYVGADTVDEDDDWEFFDVLGKIFFYDEETGLTHATFKASLVWMGDGCDLAGPVEEVVEFIDAEIDL